MASTTKISPIILLFSSSSPPPPPPYPNPMLNNPPLVSFNNINITTININGTLTCSPTLTLPATLLTPPLVNATVQITLNGAVVPAVNTTATGTFGITLNVTNVLNGPITNANLNTVLGAGCRIFTTLQPGAVFSSCLLHFNLSLIMVSLILMW